MPAATGTGYAGGEHVRHGDEHPSEYRVPVPGHLRAHVSPVSGWCRVGVKLANTDRILATLALVGARVPVCDGARSAPGGTAGNAPIRREQQQHRAVSGEPGLAPTTTLTYSRAAPPASATGRCASTTTSGRLNVARTRRGPSSHDQPAPSSGAEHRAVKLGHHRRSVSETTRALLVVVCAGRTRMRSAVRRPAASGLRLERRPGTRTRSNAAVTPQTITFGALADKSTVTHRSR